MTTILILIHVIVCIALIMIVLLQTGKGADMGAAFGGGASQTLFGASGASTFLTKATTVAAIVFMVTSLGLAYVSGNRSGKSVMSDVKAPEIQETSGEKDTEARTPSADQTDSGSQTAAQPSTEQKDETAAQPSTEQKDETAAQPSTEQKDEIPVTVQEEAAGQQTESQPESKPADAKTD